jgi:uncharacterized protein YxjI
MPGRRAAWEHPGMTDPFAHDRFVLHQRVRFVVNQYEFSLPDAEGDDEPFCFVEQKRFTFKEDIGFFADASRGTELLRIKARQRFDPAATYDITADGAVIGTIRKAFGASLLRSTFVLTNGATGVEVTARERSLVVALVRRVIGFVPYVGGVADWLPIPYDFEFTAKDGRVIGVNRRRRWRVRDVYDLDFSADTEHVLDRRLAVAAAVGTDALMAR